MLYIALGGALGVDTVAAYLAGADHIRIDVLQHNTIVQALNELSIDAGYNHPVAYIETDC